MLALAPELRALIRGLAIEAHVRLCHGGGSVPSGGSCRVCKTEWSILDAAGNPIEGREHHLPTCVLHEPSSIEVAMRRVQEEDRERSFSHMAAQLRKFLSTALCATCGEPLGTDEEVVQDDEETKTMHARCADA